MAADQALDRLRTTAGAGADEALGLLVRLLGNIVEHPEDPKYRRLKPDNPKLREALFRYAGACDFVAAVGFVRAADGCYDFPHATVGILRDACTMISRYRGGADAHDPVLAGYCAVLAGGAHGAGVGEAEAIVTQPGGMEALQMLEKILGNLRRYPDSERYRCVNLSKPAARKVLPAAPLMRLIGFEEGQLPTGEECMKISRVNCDILERVWALVWWSSVPAPLLSPGPPGGLLEHALGALLGAAIGDAMGASLGGKGPFEVTAQEVDKAMEMCGGGVWSVAPGQPTGHTELLVCLAEALAEAGDDALRAFPLEDLATRYGKWGQSQPFRGERASRQVFQRPLPAEHLAERAKDLNQKSMGSGSLNRCLPLGVFCAARGAPNAAAGLARADAALSHPNARVGSASAVYAVAAAHLISSAGDRRIALEKLQSFLSQAMSSNPSASSALALGDQVPGNWTHLPKPTTSQRPGTGSAGGESWSAPNEEVVALEVVAGWLTKAFSDRGELPFSDMSPAALLDGEVGSVEIPFEHAFRHLHRGSTFDAAMRAVLAGGGDTCSTAGAVGGLVGAAVGLRGLPPRWVKAVLCCDSNLGQFRPPEYATKCLPGLAERICAQGAEN